MDLRFEKVSIPNSLNINFILFLLAAVTIKDITGNYKTYIIRLSKKHLILSDTATGGTLKLTSSHIVPFT